MSVSNKTDRGVTQSKSRVVSTTSSVTSTTGKTPESRSRSRISIGTIVTPPWSPYKWRIPLTWQNGVKYGAAELNQAFITNMDEVPGVLVMMEEDFETSTDSDWNDITPLSYPIGSDETWAFTLVLLYRYSANFRLGFRVPAGADAAGTTFFDDSGGNAEVSTFAPSGGVYEASLSTDGDNDAIVVTIDIVVRNATTIGVFLPTVQPVTVTPTPVVRLGSALIGMRL